MGKRYKGYNWKARSQLSKSTEVSKKKKLTARERKRLEKLLEAKEKKTKRASLLQELAGHQVSAHELELLQSSAKLGTAKSSDWEQQAVEECSGLTAAAAVAISSFKPRRKRKKTAKKKTGPRAKVARTSSDSDKDDLEEEDEDEDVVEEDGEENCVEGTVQSKPAGIVEQSQEPAVQEIQEESGGRKDADEETKCVKPAVQPREEFVKPAVQPEPAVFVQLCREPAVQAARLQLPILAEEQEIMEAIRQNSVVILCGETGSGKTTQVPQFLYEAGFTKPTTAGQHRLIGVTEPRRVAAVSMSKRVGQEMGLDESRVSYQIRYEGNTTDQTEVKFMTDGVLLKAVENDFMLSDYSAIIVDEAHERSVYTDILLGLLSRIVPLRAKRKDPLKLIIMSATLRVEDFTANRCLFPIVPPVIEVQSRQYPVTIHFNKHTPNDEEYVHEAFRKVCKLHRQLPAGGILVFVTGQQEVHWLCSKLRRTFPASLPEANLELGEDVALGHKRARKTGKISLDDFAAEPTFDDHEGAEAEDFVDTAESDEESESSKELGNEQERMAGDRLLPMRVLPLFALLPPQRQAQVFEGVPDGVRLCVVATNVAETSLTIPHIKYVVDTGKVKRRYYDKVTGVSSYRVEWTSQASANQRSGRAGRTGPGHCYRLFSSAVFNNKFERYSSPEICRRPVDDLVLQMKMMYVTKVDNFPFPTPPPVESMRAAEQLLIDLGALEVENLAAGGKASTITSLGRTMASFPVSPRYGKVLALGGQQKGLLQYVVALVASVSVQEVFLGQGGVSQKAECDEKSLQRARRELVSRWGGRASDLLLGDIMVLLRAVCAAEYAGCTQRFCQDNGLRHKAIQEVRRLRRQLTSAVNAVSSSSQVVLNPQMPPPLPAQVVLLRQLVLSGLADHVARKVPTDELEAAEKKRLRFAYECNIVEGVVFLHPSSVLRQSCPEFVVFQEIVETTKPFMKCTVGVEAEWLPRLASQYCSLSDPLDIPPPCWDNSAGLVMCHRTVTFGRRCWSLPAQQLEHPVSLDKFKWFSRFLLEGKVVSPLQPFTNHLLSKPSTVLKSWAKLQPRVQALLGELVDKDISSRAALLAVWKKKPTYLLKAYLQWLPEAHHSAVQGSWPPVK